MTFDPDRVRHPALDLDGTIYSGAMSVLVLTGGATVEEAAALDPPPDLVIQDVGEFGKLLGASPRETEATQ